MVLIITVKETLVLNHLVSDSSFFLMVISLYKSLCFMGWKENGCN